MISNCNKEQLCDIIKTSHILIIIDKCSKILELNAEHFNKTLKYLVKNTMNAKFLVITYNKTDISDKFRFKVPIDINELSKMNAARLLLIVAGHYKHMKEFKSAKELS